MTTFASILLHALALATVTIMGFGMGRQKTRNLPSDEANAIIALGCATALFFALAAGLQVAS